MYWKFDANKFALHQLPPFLRTKGIYALIKCIMAGIAWVYGLFTNQRETVMQKLNHNGTTLSLENFLNEQFKLSGEIYITEYLSDNTYLHNQGETAEDVYMAFQDEENNFFLSSESPDVLSGGFCINIPEGLYTDENLRAIRKWVDYYRAAGTMYKIEAYG